jgi:hypothetical protein
MKTLTMFGKKIFTLALFAGAMYQPVLATSAAPHVSATTAASQQNSFDSKLSATTDQTMLNASISAADNAHATEYLTMEDRIERAAMADVDNKKDESTGIDDDNTDIYENVLDLLFGKKASSTQIYKPFDFKTYDDYKSYDYKPYVCPAAQCSKQYSSVNAFLYHVLSIHYQKAVDPAPTNITTFKEGDLICKCGICKDVYMRYVAAGIKPPQQLDEKTGIFDGLFTCKYCGFNVSKHTCYTHLAECPVLTAPKPMEISYE